MNKKIICNRCVMDTTAKNIFFNSENIFIEYIWRLMRL